MLIARSGQCCRVGSLGGDAGRLDPDAPFLDFGVDGFAQGGRVFDIEVDAHALIFFAHLGLGQHGQQGGGGFALYLGRQMRGRDQAEPGVDVVVFHRVTNRRHTGRFASALAGGDAQAAQAANVHLYRKLPYDPVKDFTPIGKIGETGFILMVTTDFPAKDMKEFVAYAKANPGKLAFGHGSSGSLVSAAMLTELAGLQTVNVPYKSIPPALTDLLGGQIQFAFADTGNAVAQMNGGRMRGLGVTTKKRAGKAPNVPPIGDTVNGYNVSAWFGLMAPAGVPADVQKKATATLLAVLAKPEVREKIQGVGIDLDVEDSATLAKTIDAEIKKWGGWVKTAGITPE